MYTKAEKKAEAFWDKTAKSYDKEEASDSEKHWQIVKTVSSHLKSTDLVLDFGCATGLITNQIAQYARKVKGIDISPKMVELASAKAIKNGIRNVEYTHATINSARLLPQTFDVILCLHVLHLVENPLMTIKQLKQLLKPEGTLITVTPCMRHKPLLGSSLKLLSFLGLVPKIHTFSKPELTQLFRKNNIRVEVNKLLTGTSAELMIIGKTE